MKPSKYQQAVFSTVVATNTNVTIKAGPGSGKSTTLVEACKLIPYNKSAVFLAFSKHIVESLKGKLPENIKCYTLHGMGRSAIGNHYPGEVSLYEKKQINFIEPYFAQETNMREKWQAVYAIDRVMMLARAVMAKPEKKEIEEVITNHALDLTDEQIIILCKALQDMYEENKEDKFGISIDFLDMIEMPVKNQEIRMPQFDYIFLDECQDMSELDFLFIKRIKKERGGRIIAVGDPKQSIYGFRGSHPRSFDLFANEPNTTILPLSISYRCAKAIIRAAKAVYVDIEEYDQNIEGIVRDGVVEDIREGDMVLCRNTRPLVDVFFKLLELDKKAYIVGKEMEKGLLQVLGCTNSSDSSEVALGKLSGMLAKHISSMKSQGITRAENHPKTAALQEKLDILRLLFTRFNSVYEVEQWIKEVFHDNDRPGVRLMTIHKSKGLENDRVFVIEKFDHKTLIPSSYAVTKDQLIQEKNLRFVSYTRAKKELVKLDIIS